jgi:hypothetical protein
MIKLGSRRDGDVVIFPNKCCALHLMQPDGTRKVLDYWRPIRTGDWSTDCATGRVYAVKLIDWMKFHDDPLALTNVVKAITRKGVFTGVETGFFQIVAESLMLE